MLLDGATYLFRLLAGLCNEKGRLSRRPFSS
jgi:hypothetical protein